jgi:Domain of Unknown Function (DUF748)
MDFRPQIARTMGFFRSRWMRRIGKAVLVIIVIYGLVGFFAVPPLLRHIIKGSVANSLNRHITVRRIHFNPYRLRLDVHRLHIAQRDGPQPFFDVQRLRVKVSWMSLLRLAPVVQEVRVDRPAVHLVRTPENRFNFSDLLETPANKPSAPASKKPLKFAISNIVLHEGDVRFDDQLLKQQHAVEHIELHVPFIANLPSDVNVYVQPLLAMVVDGSHLRIDGKARPFASPPESIVNLDLHKFDLTRYLGYVPAKLPIRMPSGTLSSALQIHFVNAPTKPLIRVGGEVALDKIDVRDTANAPLAGLEHAAVALTNVEPLEKVAHFSRIYIGGLGLYVTRNHDGSINLASLSAPNAAAAKPRAPPVAPANQSAANAGQMTAGAPAPAATPSPAPPVAPANRVPGGKTGQLTAVAPARAASPSATPANQTGANTSQLTSAAPAPAAPAPAAPAAAGTSSPPADISLDSFELADSAVNVTDNSGPAPAKLGIQAIHFGLKNLRTAGQAPPALFDMAANLSGGGTIGAKGAVDVAKSQATTDISVNQIDLPALQGFAQSILAAVIASGKLSASTKLVANFGSRFNVHAEPASASLDNFEMRDTGGGETPIKWKQLSVTVNQFDLAARQAAVKEIRLDGLNVLAKREHDGQLNMAALIRQPQAAASQPGAAAPSTPDSQRPPPKRRGKTAPDLPRSHSTAAPASSWRYGIALIAVENTQARVEDHTMREPLLLTVAPLNLHLHDISSDMAKPIPLDLDATVNGKGGFKVIGTAAPIPLKADLRIVTRRLDLSPADPYLSSRLNATIKSAALTSDGKLEVARERDNLRLRYRGNTTLAGVRMLDKVTNDLFLRWSAFSADGIDFAMGAGPPRVHVRGVALANFYSRIILNRDGHLNLRDVMASPQAAPTSLTRPDVLVPTKQPSAPAAPAPPSAPEPKPLPANIEIGRISFEGGRVKYTDNFIKPNYSADLSDITGRVGAFGTGSTTPADVKLQGELNGSSPIDIDGSVNPLTPMAFVDLKAKASGVELTELSPYSTKYTGYPITKGTLDVDVHYLLEKQNLTAENHIFISQLTFGDKVENSTAMNLPIRLAVALLKNPRGEIDLRVPVSGSLADPQFSIGSVVLHAFMNIIVKAATSPFSLLASAFGGNASEDYGHILFDPGFATLTPTAQGKLDTLTKALQDRPALRLNITGRVDPKFDVEGLRQARLARAVKVQKIEDVGGDLKNPASIQVTPDEYDKYLKLAYKAAKFKKPRDAIGFTKSLPSDQMKKLMLENTQVSDQDLHDLAEARANVIRKALAAKVDPKRLFITAPKLDANGIKDKDKTTRADLSLE